MDALQQRVVATELAHAGVLNYWRMWCPTEEQQLQSWVIGRPEQSVSMTEIDSLKPFLDRAQLSLKTVAIELMNCCLGLVSCFWLVSAKL